MKYMTADLIARFRSTDDRIADAAADDWDRACASYNNRIESIKANLPASVQQLLEGPCLHDARVLTAFMEADCFCILLQLDNPPRKLELKYTLAEREKGFGAQRHQQLENDGQRGQWVMYDEIEVLNEGDRPVFLHSILLTGGWEFNICFHDLACLPIRWVLSSDWPSASGGSEEEALAAYG
jgi:hypothetical protein